MTLDEFEVRAAISPPGPAWLHNTGAAPRTGAALHLGDPRGPFVRFDAAPEAAAGSAIDDEVLDRLWDRFGFRGAALVYPWSSEPAGVKERCSRNRRVPELLVACNAGLSLNVLRRQRSGLLIAGMSLCPQSLGPGPACVWTNDPQLVRIARKAGTKEIS